MRISRSMSRTVLPTGSQAKKYVQTMMGDLKKDIDNPKLIPKTKSLETNRLILSY